MFTVNQAGLLEEHSCSHMQATTQASLFMAEEFMELQEREKTQGHYNYSLII